MTWWFHLLVRRVDELEARCAVFERVVRAGAGGAAGASGALAYAERVFPLLLRSGITLANRRVFDRWTEVVYSTVEGVTHRGADLPAVVQPGGAQWFTDGVRYRPGGRGKASSIFTPCIVEVHENGVLAWTGANGSTLCTVSLPAYLKPRQISLDLILPPQ